MARNGYTTVMAAARRGDAELVSLLIHEGANADAEAADGCSAASVACAAGHLEVLRRLADFGVDLHVANSRGQY